MAIETSVLHQEEQNARFNPREHLIQIKSGQRTSDYLPVQWRLVWFREECMQGSIETELVHLDLERDTESEVYAWNAEKRRSEKTLKHAKGIAIFKATIQDGKGAVASGFGSESASDFNDFLEKAETKAIGRALAALGYGTQFAPELDEHPRIVDSPVERSTNSDGSVPKSAQNEGTTFPPEDAPASEQQIASIRKLAQLLSKPEPDRASLSYASASAMLQQLSAEYRAKRQSLPSR